MGNWRQVSITGTIDERHVQPLTDYLSYSMRGDSPGLHHFGPLSFCRDSPSLCGVNNWVAAEVNAAGNLAERDYSVEAVADQLRELLAVAPSMMLTVHCGGDYESDTCVATILVGEGLVAIRPPGIERVAPPDDDQMLGNLLHYLR